MGHSPSLCIKGNAKSQRNQSLLVLTHRSVQQKLSQKMKRCMEEAEDEFDESSDEDVDDDTEVSTLVQGEIGSSATFLLGARTRFGIRGSGAFQQPSALLNSSNVYVNF